MSILPAPTARKAAHLGTVARDHHRAGTITAADCAELCQRVHAACRRRWDGCATDADVDAELDRIAAEIAST